MDDESYAKLVADMEAGRTPANCNVLFDTMGARPDVDVTDPNEIAKVYELLALVEVNTYSNAMPVTDSYHHVIFTLQDGTKAGFGFEGAGVWTRGRDSYPVYGDGALWAYVKQLQDVKMGKATMGAPHAIRVDPENDLIVDAPSEARAGDVVVVYTVDVTDADLVVSVSGGYDGEFIGGAYVFIMPDRDVAIEASTRDYPFGGGA